MQDSAEAIIEEIRIAFANVKRGRITLHEAEEIDNYSTAEICALARLKDKDSHWEEVPDEHIFRCRCTLIYLDPESWRYYIPAYMIFTLRYCDQKPHVPDEGYYTSASIDSTIFTLSDNFDPERYQRLNTAQSRVIYRFLRYFAEMGDSEAERAIEVIWMKFCQE